MWCCYTYSTEPFELKLFTQSQPARNGFRDRVKWGTSETEFYTDEDVQMVSTFTLVVVVVVWWMAVLVEDNEKLSAKRFVFDRNVRSNV